MNFENQFLGTYTGIMTHNDQFLKLTFKESFKLELADFEKYVFHFSSKGLSGSYASSGGIWAPGIDPDNEALSIILFNSHKHSNPVNPIEYFAFKLPLMEKGTSQIVDLYGIDQNFEWVRLGQIELKRK
ncbi:MAG: hypothetical protein JXA66_02790 [Oligoflexia bacterium]|nr:hypothetical protein [Oligoflexia bacterium]